MTCLHVLLMPLSNCMAIRVDRKDEASERLTQLSAAAPSTMSSDHLDKEIQCYRERGMSTPRYNAGRDDRAGVL